MSYNSFDYYQQLRQHQLHMQKLANPETQVPSHQAFKALSPKVEKVKEYKRNEKLRSIEHENAVIMNKLVGINRRKPAASQSMSNLSLPPIKPFNIPLYEHENNHIAKRIIESKSRIGIVESLQGYRQVEAHKRNISKYLNQEGVIVNRKKYLAELLLLKKMRVSQLITT